MGSPTNPDQDATVYCNGSAVSVPPGFAVPSEMPRTIVRFKGPILPAWRSALADSGADYPETHALQPSPRDRTALPLERASALRDGRADQVRMSHLGV